MSSWKVDVPMMQHIKAQILRFEWIVSWRFLTSIQAMPCCFVWYKESMEFRDRPDFAVSDGYSAFDCSLWEFSFLRWIYCIAKYRDPQYQCTEEKGFSGLHAYQ